MYFLQVRVTYIDDIIVEFYCDTCELAKAIKLYNQIPNS